MGTWGIKIYQNDISSEVKADYKNKLKVGKTDEAALNEILEEYQDCIGDQDDQYDFWFALADTMWTLGRLTDSVNENTLKLIEQEDQEGRWEKEKDRKTRLFVLEELKQKLLSEMPPKKKISIYKPFVTPWKKGDVYVYQIKEIPPLDEAYNPPKSYHQYVGWYITIYVHDIEEDKNIPGAPDLIPVVYLALSERKPESISDIDNLIFIYLTIGNPVMRNYKFRIVDRSIKKYPNELNYLGNDGRIRELKNEYQGYYYIPYWWSTIEIETIRGYIRALSDIKNQN